MNELIISDRIEELNEYIQNFPDSRLTPIHQKEIDYLTALLEYDYDKAEKLKALL